MPSSSVPVPEWWLGSQDSLQAITHAAPCAAHPALLLPLSAAYLPPTSVAMASVDDAAPCVVGLTCRDPPAATDGDLVAAPALPHLKALVLEACGNLTAAAMRHISQSKTLEDLRLDGTPVDDGRAIEPTRSRRRCAASPSPTAAARPSTGSKSMASLRRLTALNLDEFDDDDGDGGDDGDDGDLADDVDGAASVVGAHHEEQWRTDTSSDEDTSGAAKNAGTTRWLAAS